MKKVTKPKATKKAGKKPAAKKGGAKRAKKASAKKWLHWYTTDNHLSEELGKPAPNKWNIKT